MTVSHAKICELEVILDKLHAIEEFETINVLDEIRKLLMKDPRETYTGDDVLYLIIDHDWTYGKKPNAENAQDDNSQGTA